MKKALLSLMFIAVLGSTGLFAQKAVKIGYCNVDYVLAYLPATKAAQDAVAAHEKQLQNRLQEKVKEFQTKYAEYEKLAPSLSETMRSDREQELKTLEQGIQVFQQKAEAELQKKQTDLMKPVFERINVAIKDVAIENGYTYIFNANEGGLSIVLYAPDENNVSNLILKKLGVTPPPLPAGN